MTIEYKDSKRIVALSSDTNPTDVRNSSLLVEKDVARRYWFSANPLLNDDFSSDNFTHADSSKTSVASDKFNWEIELDNSDAFVESEHGNATSILKGAMFQEIKRLNEIEN